jgi:lactoylglutathione lyase
MRFLHTMVRVRNLEESLKFYTEVLGLVKTRHDDYEKGRFSLIFLAAPNDEQRAKEEKAPVIELTYNWDEEEYKGGRNFGHLAYEVDNIYEYCTHLQKQGVTINRPPRDGWMAFIKSPDGISIELLQKGEKLEVQEPWASMENIGTW